MKPLTYSNILKKRDSDLLNEMLLSKHKYSESIDAKGKDFYRITINVIIVWTV